MVNVRQTMKMKIPLQYQNVENMLFLKII